MSKTVVGGSRFSCCKFSTVIKDNQHKKLAELIFISAFARDLICPEITFLENGNIKFKWAEDNYYIIIVINVKFTKIDYVIGNNHGHRLFTSSWKSEDITEIFETLDLEIAEK